jgi:integrase/recombinase XerD
VRKGVRKHGRVSTTRKVTESFTMVEMFERFMRFKNSEGLAPRTVEDYEIHFQWLCDYFGKELSREEMTTEAFYGCPVPITNVKGYCVNCKEEVSSFELLN